MQGYIIGRWALLFFSSFFSCVLYDSLSNPDRFVDDSEARVHSFSIISAARTTCKKKFDSTEAGNYESVIRRNKNIVGKEKKERMIDCPKDLLFFIHKNEKNY